MVRFSCSVAAEVALVVVAAVALADTQGLSLGWSKQFRSPELEYEYLAGGVALGNDSMWMVIGTRARGQLGGEQQQVLWRLDGAKGEKRHEIAVTEVFGTASTTGRQIDVRGLATDGAGGVVGIATDGRQIMMVTLEDRPAGEPTVVGAEARGIRVERVIPVSRGFLLLGRSESHGWALAVREDGAVLWESTYRDSPVSVLTDAIAVDDGTIVAGTVLGRAGETSVWLARLDLHGDVVYERSMPGRYASVARTQDGGAVLLYDLRAQRGWDLFLRGLDGHLDKLWETKVGEELHVMRPFRLGSTATGELTVVGEKGKRLWISSFDARGKRLFSHLHTDGGASWQRIWNFDLLAVSQEWIVAYTEVLVGADQQQRQSVGLLKLGRE